MGKIEKIDVIFFDLFFTLVNPKYEEKIEDNEYFDLKISQKEWEEAAENDSLYKKRALGEVKNPKEIIQEIVKKLDLRVPEEIINIIMNKRIQRFKNTLLKIDEDILETLDTIYKRSKRMCLISNADVIDKKAWILSPLSSYFEQSIFSCDVGLLKPNNKIYELALETMKVKPENALFIGDGGSKELKGAKQAGIKTILITHYLDSYPEEVSKDADLIIDKFEELKNIIK